MSKEIQNNTLWHTLSTKEIFATLESSPEGLSKEKVSILQTKYGMNALPKEKPLPSLVVLFNQFKSPLVYVLIGAAAVSIFLQDYVDAIVILIAVLINTILGFYQENKANKSIAYLKQLIDHKSKVLRDGHEMEVDSSELVPGDIMLLDAGDKISADGRLIQMDNFKVIEAALTGESEPSDKTLKTLEPGEALADRENMVYSGTVVASGRAQVIVTGTGSDTEIGNITKLVQDTKEDKTPLQRQLATFSRVLTYIIIGLSALIIVIGALQGRPIFGFGHSAREGMLNTAAAIAVSAIPEGLLISVTAILAIGMQAILKRKALVRKLIAAETLGSVSVICTDKTGTLTEGNMQVSKIVTPGKEVDRSSFKFQDTAKLKDHDLIVKISVLCNDAAVENPDAGLEQWKILGTPTEKALLLGALQAGVPFEKIKDAQERISEIPFDSEWKYMATLNKLDAKRNVVYVKGAPEVIFGMANKIRVDGKKIKLGAARLKALQEQYESLTSQGLRLLAVGYKQINSKKDIKLKDELDDIIFAGFIALKDPLRKQAKETIRLASKAGIRPVIITGDHKLTAKAIVSELGIKVEDENILLGADLDKLSDAEFDQIVTNIDIYARVEPKHKLRIIRAWQKRGESVAMTGDGVNDAPALKSADVGIAFGSGTDVAKETSDIILLDNNFKTIVAAVERGRVIYDNIKKVILYLLTDSFSEIILITGALILALPLPILPAQIIWINLVADSFIGLALTVEKGEKEVMKDKPRKKNAKILDRDMKVLIFTIGIITDFVLLALFWVLLKNTGLDLDHVRTIIFTALAIDSLLYVFSARSLRHSVFTKNPFDNKYLVAAVIFGFVLQLLAVYTPLLQKAFSTVPLSLENWLFVFGLALLKITGIEITKHFLIVHPNRKLQNA